MLPEELQFHIKCSAGDVGRYVLLPGDPNRAEKIAEYFENAEKVAGNREFYIYTGYISGEKVSVCSTGIGAPSTAIAVEELCNIGAEYLIRVGTCGGISTDVIGGDIVLPTAAVRQEGTTGEYIPYIYPAVADFSVITALSEAAAELGARTHIGIVQSKDSFYGQHSPARMPSAPELGYKWEAWKKAGVLASEMECSALFVVGGLRKAKTGAVLHTVWNQEREKQGLANPQTENTDLAVKIAVKAVEKLILSSK